jgi:cytochrome b pre-mRNA-processing protein 3
MIILNMFPVFEALQLAGPRGRTVARLVSETFVTDIDDYLREEGVGDLTVPKKVKRAAQALGERCLGYHRALNAPDPAAALAAEIGATVPGLEANPEAAAALARYTLSACKGLSDRPDTDVIAGRIAFPAL